MKRRIVLALVLVVVGLISGRAQSPVPVITPATKAATISSDAGSSAPLLKMLQQLKAVNEETLRKQAALLDQLDELEKAADQLRIFSRRS